MNHQKPTKDKDQKPVVTDESLVPADAPISTPKHHVKLKTQNPKNKWLIAALVLALVLLIAAIPLYIYAIRNNLKEVSDTTGPTAEQVQNQDKSLCFVRLAHLVCTDISGRNYVRYDLPKLSDGAEIESLSASADQSKYVAYTTSSSSNLRVVVLDKNLKIIKELTMPSGLTPNAPIMAADGKSILLELAGSTEYSIGRHIYRYDIATGKY
ncbi:MAG: hypothetical protein M0R39_17710, partial [Prolixibacteraceae bacterium]|nr:hypothetical protein [Prolixibacteraceae bacterium]